MDEEWQRMTVGKLRLWLKEAVESGVCTDDSVVFVDSDPEGNDTNPMRVAAEPAAVRTEEIHKGTFVEVIDDSASFVELPAKAVWFGVGY
jgi:hypothetical protein